MRQPIDRPLPWNARTLPGTTLFARRSDKERRRSTGMEAAMLTFIVIATVSALTTLLI